MKKLVCWLLVLSFFLPLYMMEDRAFSPCFVDDDLLKAINEGNYDRVESLLARGADCNVYDHAGQTALIRAVIMGNVKMVELLLMVDAERDKCYKNFLASLKNDENEKEPELLPCNVEKMRNSHAYSKLAINAKDSEGANALIHATINDCKEIVHLLLDAGVDVNSRTAHDQTALAIAAENKFMEIAELLIHYGADVNALDKWHQTPLKYATVNGCKEIIKLINESIALVPDDDAKPTCWVKNLPESEITEKKLGSDCSITKQGHYRPRKITDGMIVWIVIPDYENKDDLVCRHTKRAAAWHATKKNKELQLLFFKWLPSLTKMGNSKKKAAKELCAFLSRLKRDDSEIVLVGYESGCHVANKLTRLSRSDNPIHLLIYFACPIQLKEQEQPKHYKHLIYFYPGTGSKSLLKNQKIGEEEAMKAPFSNFIYYANNFFKNFLRNANPFGYGDNEFETPEGRITTGIQVLTRGQNNNFFHLTKMDAIKFLPSIIAKLHDEFPYHYSKSANFLLNIDEGDTDKPVYLVALPFGPHEGVPDFDYLGAKDVLTNCNRSHLPIELDLAASERKRFKAKYNCDIFM